MKITKYPNIVRAAHEIALDNGCINRHEVFDASKFDVSFDSRWLDRVNYILGIINNDAFEVICCGDVKEADAIHRVFGLLGRATKRVLNEIFEQL